MDISCITPTVLPDHCRCVVTGSGTYTDNLGWRSGWETSYTVTETVSTDH